MTQPKAPWKCFATKNPYPLLTREQAVAIVGEAQVEAVESNGNAYLTSQTNHAALTVVGARVPVTEIKAQGDVDHPDYNTLSVYWYARKDWLDNPEVDGWDNLDWQPYGYQLD